VPRVARHPRANLNDLFQAGTANSDSVSNPGFITAPVRPSSRRASPAGGLQLFRLRDGQPEPDAGKVQSVERRGSDLADLPARLQPCGRLFQHQGEQRYQLLQRTTDRQFVLPGEQVFCDAISVDPSRTQNPAQPYLLIRTQPFNAASQKVRGVDIDASYRLPLDRLFSEPMARSHSRSRHPLSENRFDSGVPVRWCSTRRA
jgi:hypothetical protein